ncbi:MAG: hypothetical protein NVSMB57_07830 [Actinomycetota bacterium]
MSALVDDLESLGFRRIGARRAEEWVKQATPYLTYSLHALDDGGVLFTWELSIGELMNDLGFQIGSNDPLNIFLFPQGDSRGPATIEFIQAEIKRTEQALGNLDLLGGR